MKNLIELLQEEQERAGYISEQAMSSIATATGKTIPDVRGVATFYAQFRLNPVGKHVVTVCQGTACHVNGADALMDALCEHLCVKEGGTTTDGLFTVETAACLGCCSLSPVAVIDDATHGNLVPDGLISAVKGVSQ